MDTEAFKIVKNTFVLSVARILSPLLSLLLVLAIARLLGVLELGKYSFVFSFLFVFQIISSFGARFLLAQRVAEDRSLTSKYLVNSFLLGFFWSALFTLAMVVAIYFMGYDRDITLSLYIVSFSLTAYTLVRCCSGILTGLEEIQCVAYISIMENAARVLLSLLVLLKGHGIVAIATVALITQYLALFFSLYFILNRTSFRPSEVDLDFCKRLAYTASAFALIIICVTIYWRAGVIMLSKMRGIEDVGLYSAAFRLLQIAIILPQSVGTTILPIMTRHYKLSIDLFRPVCSKAIHYLIIVAIPIALATNLLAERLVVLLYGEEFLGSANTLRILIWTLVPYSVSVILVHGIIATGNVGLNIRVNVLRLLSNITLNLMLIPRFGILGAGLATFIAGCIYLLLMYPFVIQNGLRLNLPKVALKSLSCACIMGAAIVVLQGVNLLIIILFSAIVYLLFSVLIANFPQRELNEGWS